MLSVALSGLILLCNFFDETYFCHLHAYQLACFYELHLKFITSHICFHLDDYKLCKQNQFFKSRDDGVDMRFRNI